MGAEMQDLFADGGSGMARLELAPGAVLLRGRAQGEAAALLAAIEAIAAEAPFRRMTTPGGFAMSVAMTNCGVAGWVTNRSGYRYTAEDPETGRPWPPMPAVFQRLAAAAAAEAGCDDFAPDACLINRYEPGARMSLHQDKDEADFAAPIVSVSLGLPATFQFGGLSRKERPRNLPLRHGDVVVWGGPSRLAYHGVLALQDGEHPMTGRVRFNLSFARRCDGADGRRPGGEPPCRRDAGCRESERNPRADPGDQLDREAAAVRLHESASDREAKAKAAARGLACHSFAPVGRPSRAFIGHNEVKSSVALVHRKLDPIVLAGKPCGVGEHAN